MKAITLWEPWATLVAVGGKRIETRSWATNHRGPLAIHAAKRDDELRRVLSAPQYAGLRRILDRFGLQKLRDFSPGAVVCVCDVVACTRVELLDPTMDEFVAGDFTVGRFGWSLANVRRLDPPIAATGSQGFWEWTPAEAMEAAELFA